jgi:hypothetical protein
MIYLSYEQLLSKYYYLLRNSDGILYDNHETSGESKDDYTFLHHYFVHYAYEKYTNLCCPFLIDSNVSFHDDLNFLIDDLRVHISFLHYLQLLNLCTTSITTREIIISDIVYVIIDINRYISLKTVFDFLIHKQYFISCES